VHELLISSSNAARLKRARIWLLEQASRRLFATAPEMIVLAPSRRAADDFVRSCCPEGGGLMGVHRTTLKQLASELASVALAGGQLAVLGTLGTEALASRVVHLALAEKPLEYFQPVARTPGFAHALAATLSELRLEGIRAGDLARGSEGGQDLAHLLECFEHALKVARLADTASVLSMAEVTARDGAHRLDGSPMLLLDVSPSNRSECALIEALASRSEDTMAIAHAHDEHAIERLERALSVKASPIAVDTGVDGASALERARSRVFLQGDLSDHEGDDTLQLFSAPGEGRECTEIARRLIAATEGGERFDRMAILLRDPDRYQPLVEESLKRARIPAFYTQGTVRPDPSGRALLSLLACASENLTATRFAEYLSLGQVPALDVSGAPPLREVAWVPPKDEIQLVFKSQEALPEAPIPPQPAPPAGEDAVPDDAPVIAGTLQTPSAWEKLLVDAAVIGSRDRWEKRLTGYQQELEQQRTRIGADDPAEKEHLDRALTRLNHLQRFALPLITFLAELPHHATWKVWLDRLTALAGMALRDTRSVSSVISELRPMEDVGPVTLDEVREVLNDRLTLLRAEPPERRYGKVFVGTTHEAGARSFAVVFLPGLAEGVFPKKRLEDPLLLDEKRRHLAPHLEVQAERFAKERMLLQMALGAAERQLVTSYSRMDVAEGRARVPSFYALDVIRAAEGRLPKLSALEKKAARGASARLGWPAPRSPELAIDDAEFDLAVLDEVLHAPPDQAAGRGFYFLQANPHLYRSLRARAERWRRRWRPADGFIAVDEETRALLVDLRLSQRGYAATDLQHVAACPYRFLLRAVHRLRPRETSVALEELDPRTWGILFHDVQFEVFGELRARKLIPMRADQIDRILEVIDQVTLRVANEYEERLAPAIPRVWSREIDELKRDLRGWARHMTTSESTWSPLHAELSFGSRRRPAADPSSVATEVTILDGVRLRGAIDVVEENALTQEIRVTDYKTGAIPSDPPRYTGHGEVLQPLLYVLAAEQILGREVARGRLHYATSSENYQSIEIEATGEARGQIGQALDLIDETIGSAFFPAAPRAGACEYCDFKRICGPHEEQRASQKDADALVTIKRLRSIP
jgi:RecB family exonuclease